MAVINNSKKIKSDSHHLNPLGGVWVEEPTILTLNLNEKEP